MCYFCCAGIGAVCCPRCYSNKRKRSNFKGHLGYRERPKAKEEDVKKPPKKPEAQKPPEAPINPEAAREFERRFPNLYSYLFDTKWEDGTPRITSTITFFVERGILKVVLNDNDQWRSAFKSAPSLLEGLDMLEEGLLDESLDWRPKRGQR